MAGKTEQTRKTRKGMKKKTDELPFTYESVLKELDSYRNISREDLMTEDQKNFLIKCRDNEHPVPFIKMASLWEKLGWGKMSKTTIHKYYTDLKKKI